MNGWQYLGYASEATDGHALSNASFVNAAA